MSGDVFETTDLQLAAFLVTLGYRVRAVDGPKDRRRFVFEAVAASDVTDYYAGAGHVNARDLFRTYRDLKSLLFQTA